MTDVAIVGLDCRFPGAPDARAYWELLMRSGDGVGAVPANRWDRAEFHSPEGGDGRANTDQGGFVADPDAFDNEFFTISPREAQAMDPQQRLLLQCAWRSLEDAGVAPGTLAGSDTGVFVGIMGNEWAHQHLTDFDRITAQVGSGNGYCMTANRISYHLDLKGPSLAVDTACSSSLVAVHLAVNSLLSGECSTALAGGVNITVSPALGIFYTRAGLSAPDGRCKPFSADADGIGRGEGVGMVVLRRLEDALADGQQVYAVIRGTAVNQDGRSNGLTAPNRWAQQAVVEAACRRARVEPAEVTFIEGHGTGTELGDMIETKALGALHASRTGRPLALGSVKGNLGHTEGAAGVAGLIKVALALHHRVVPASRFARRENPKLGLAAKGIRLLKAPLRLPTGTAVAGLSSFGMGGTNAHAVLASAPPQAVRPAGGGLPEGGVFTLSAPSPEALRRNLLVQAEELTRSRARLPQLCWSSNQVKTGHRFRFAFAAADTAGLAHALRAAAEDDEQLTRHTSRPAGRPRTAFLFTGQGAQSPGMTMRLYRESPRYAHHLDRADAALRPHLGLSVRDLLDSGDLRIHRTGLAQPALFAVGLALAETLRELGAEPGLLLGHSVGEFAAAVVAQALTLDQAAALITARGRLMDALPDGGGMLSVFAPEAEVRPLAEAEPLVGVAAVNGPRQTVLSGDLRALERIAGRLAGQGVESRPLNVSHAFHSPLMEPMLAEFARVARDVGGGVPRIPFHSTVRGRLLEPGEALDAAYWVEHVGATVRFADAANALFAAGPTHVVEIGPTPVLGGLVRRLRPPAGLRSLHPLPVEDSGRQQLAELVARLYQDGLDPDWEAFYPQEQRRGVRLAPYAFSDAHRFWAEPPTRRGRPRSSLRLQPEPGEPLPQEPAGLVRLAPAGRSAFTGRVPERVAAAVARVGGYSVDELSAHSRLYEDLGFDSVLLMELKKQLEQQLPELGALSVPDLLPVLSSVAELTAWCEARAASATATAAS
ncbi:type I polyketide synthase [Streptomyces sp. NPDC001380]|uniref:type I polyketide synthase n=1 Tax=Streptomyces sp. NPDC001380 TaxID=3364566 RepID=UPI0036D17F97